MAEKIQEYEQRESMHEKQGSDIQTKLNSLLEENDELK